MEHSHFVMTTEAARILHVSAETIRSWANQGKLPAIVLARGVRVFERVEVERIAHARQKA